MEQTKKAGSYGYVIVASLFIQMFLAGAILTTAGMFIVPVTTALNLTQGVYMLYMTIQYGTMAVMGIFMPKLLGKFKFVTLNRCAIVIMALGAFCMAMAKNIALIYLGGVFLGASMVIVTYQSAGILIPRFFKARVGVMLATATMGMTIAGAIMSPVISKLLTHETVLGMEAWRGIYVLLGAALLILGLINAIALLRENPKDGLRIGEDALDAAEGQSAQESKGIMKEKAIKSVSFVFFILMVITFNFAAPVQSYLPAYAGLSEAAQTASFDVVGILASVVLIASVIGNYAIGFAIDKAGARGGAVLAGVCGVLGFLILLLAKNSAGMMLAGGALFGLYYPISGLIMPAMLLNMYGDKDYNRIFPTAAAWGPWFGAVAASLWGFIYDTTGSYDTVFVIALILCAGTAIFTILGVKSSKKLWNE